MFAREILKPRDVENFLGTKCDRAAVRRVPLPEGRQRGRADRHGLPARPRRTPHPAQRDRLRRGGCCPWRARPTSASPACSGGVARGPSRLLSPRGGSARQGGAPWDPGVPSDGGTSRQWGGASDAKSTQRERKRKALAVAAKWAGGPARTFLVTPGPSLADKPPGRRWRWTVSRQSSRTTGNSRAGRPRRRHCTVMSAPTADVDRAAPRLRLRAANPPHRGATY